MSDARARQNSSILSGFGWPRCGRPPTACSLTLLCPWLRPTFSRDAPAALEILSMLSHTPTRISSSKDSPRIHSTCTTFTQVVSGTKHPARRSLFSHKRCHHSLHDSPTRTWDVAADQPPALGYRFPDRSETHWRWTTGRLGRPRPFVSNHRPLAPKLSFKNF